MLIQLIFFLTKNKIFVSEINSKGAIETISINGNKEIKNEGKKSIDETIGCIFDFYNIEDFSDEMFDLIIINAGADRESVNYVYEKCRIATMLSCVSLEKILPVIINNQNLLQPGEEATVAFADLFYKASCNEHSSLTIEETQKTEKAVLLNGGSFAWLYKPVVNVNGCDESKLKAAEIKIEKYEAELANYIFKQAFEYHNSGNYEDAYSLYKKAADLGSLPAVVGLGWMYDMGQGVTQSYEKAAALYRKAAAQGNDIAQNNLGAKYENGQGVAKNYEKAVEYYRKAAEQGNELARNNLNRFTICPDCGTVLIAGSFYCDNCGKQLW